MVQELCLCFCGVFLGGTQYTKKPACLWNSAKKEKKTGSLGEKWENKGRANFIWVVRNDFSKVTFRLIH